MTRPIRICFMCTHSFTLATLYKGLFPYLADHGYEIEAIVGDHEYQSFDPKHFGEFKLNVVPMRRMPHPLKDAVALFRLFRLFRAGKFDVIHVSTPKAALLGSIAGRLSGAPVVFVYRRCVYEMMTGFKRWSISRTIGSPRPSRTSSFQFRGKSNPSSVRKKSSASASCD